MDERNAKLTELLQDEAFVKEMVSIVEPKDAQKFFADHGLDYSMSEIMAMGKILKRMGQQRQGDELSEDELAQVAGGEFPAWAIPLTGVGLLCLFVAGMLGVW